MSSTDFHFEVFVRHKSSESWRLEAALDNRDQALALGESLFAEGAAAVRVSKEVRDPETGEYDSRVILTKGAQLQEKRRPVRNPAAEPPCATVQDLYAAPARDKIGRVLEDWLRRQRATPFELLHRPDLAAKLETTGMELQHALQKIAVPESQLTGASVHEVMRSFHKLVDGALQQLAQAGRKGLFPDLDRESLSAAAERLAEAPDRSFLLGGAVARRLAEAPDWNAKVERICELAEGLTDESPAGVLGRAVLEQPLSEILASPSRLSDLLGQSLDPGGALLALTRLIFPAESESVMDLDPAVASLAPELTGPAARLAALMSDGCFKSLRSALARKIVAELGSARRLRPDDADGEIVALRALAMVLTAVLTSPAGRLLSIDDVQAAFLTRSKALTSGDFVTALSQGRPNVLAEAQALTRLAENVTGPMNRKRAADWLSACIDSVRFETELRGGGAETALARLSALTGLDRAMRRARLGEGDQRRISERLGELAGKIEADARLCALLVRSPAPLLQRVGLLLRLAGAEMTPPGPAADRARTELLRLLKEPEARAELAAAPEVAGRVRELMSA